MSMTDANTVQHKHDLVHGISFWFILFIQSRNQVDSDAIVWKQVIAYHTDYVRYGSVHLSEVDRNSPKGVCPQLKGNVK